MAKSVLLDEFHVTLRAPPGIAASDCTSLRRVLDSPRFHAALRRAVRKVLNTYPALHVLRLSVSR